MLPLPPLALAFALGYALFVAALGLRPSVLITGLVPPLAGFGVCRQLAARERRRRLAQENPGGAGSLMDAAALARRLDQLERLRPQPWADSRPLLEEIRQLALRCAQRDPHRTVDLLVLLEELLDRLQSPAAAAALRPRLPELRDQLARACSAAPGEVALPSLRLP
jgi:hypothetical protein